MEDAKTKTEIGMTSDQSNTAPKTTVHNLTKTNIDKNDSNSPKETTRKYIAQLYVWAFFVVIGLVFIIGVIKCFNVDDYKDMLVTVSGILSGPLGFIVGYYFKASNE